MSVTNNGVWCKPRSTVMLSRTWHLLACRRPCGGCQRLPVHADVCIRPQRAVRGGARRALGARARHLPAALRHQQRQPAAQLELQDAGADLAPRRRHARVRRAQPVWLLRGGGDRARSTRHPRPPPLQLQPVPPGHHRRAPACMGKVQDEWVAVHWALHRPCVRSSSACLESLVGTSTGGDACVSAFGRKHGLVSL